MGERVVIGPEPHEAAAPTPLNYGRGNRRGDAWRRFAASAAVLAEAVQQRIVPALGGWRQIGFALGLGLILGGLGNCIKLHLYSDGDIIMFIGGVLVGLCIRVPLAIASK